MNKKILLLLLAALLLISGCWDQQTIENLAIALGMGIDVVPEDPELLLLTTINPTFSETATAKAKRLVSKGYTLPQTFAAMQRQRNHKLVLGQVAVIVFSEAAAKAGLLNRILLELDQVRDVDPDVFVLVVRGAAAKEVLYLEPKEEERVAVYLKDMLDRNVENGTVPRVTAARYWTNYATVGIDPVVPLIELAGGEEENSGVIITGLAALDSAGKMQGALTDQETVLFLLLSGQNQQGQFSTQLNIAGKHRNTTMLIKKASPTIKAERKEGKTTIEVKLTLVVDVIDIEWGVDVVARDGVAATIASALARDIQGNALNLLRKTQQWGADIIGLGQYARIASPKWFKTADWSKEYSESTISLEVEVKIRRIGTLTNPEY